MREEVRLWIEAAREDLEDAEHFLKIGRWFRAAFFAQQCVEKILKAACIVFCREEPPRTHIVTLLYRKLRECGFRLPEDLEHVLPLLNKYYTITCYPDAANGLPSESVDEEEARRAVGIARRVYEYIVQEIFRGEHTRESNRGS